MAKKSKAVKRPSGANRQNALLATLEAQKEIEFDIRFQRHTELDRMALLIAAHRKLKVGPGRAAELLKEHARVKIEIAGMIKDDVGDTYRKKDALGDPEFLQTKYHLAHTLKDILGPEAWDKYKEHFPMVQEYWDI